MSSRAKPIPTYHRLGSASGVVVVVVTLVEFMALLLCHAGRGQLQTPCFSNVWSVKVKVDVLMSSEFLTSDVTPCGLKDLRFLK